jgi:hypothetical protein
MYNMEIYCTRPYCIENLYWTRRLRRLAKYGFSIQYRLIQYISHVDILDIVVTLLKIVLNNKSYYIGTLLCRYPRYSCDIAKDGVKQ